MQMFNPTKKTVEFRYGGEPHVFKPGESKALPDHIAKHAIRRARAPLVEHTQTYDKDVAFSDTKYSNMGWKAIQGLASSRGLFKLGMSRSDVEEALEKYDSETRTL